MVRITDRYNITHEPISLLVGVVGIIFGLYYVLQKFNIINSAFNATENSYLYFFIGYTLVAGIILTFNAMRKTNY